MKMALHTKGRLHPLLHFGVFFFLGILSILASDKNRVRLLFVFAAIVLGVSIEYVEKVRVVIPLELYDVVNDTCGVFVGALTGWIFARKAG